MRLPIVCMVLAVLAPAWLAGDPLAQRGAGASAVLPSVPGADVLTGRVTDAAGRPVPGTFVSALFPASQGRRYSSEPTTHATLTDERGEFQLKPGERQFYLIAIPQGTAADSVNRMGSAITFYPSALVLGEAKALRMTPARLTRAEIVLRPARLWAVSGRVLTSTGQLVRGGKLELDHLDGLYSFNSRVVDIGSDGTFGLPALPPGSYFLQYREAGSVTGNPSEWKMSRAKVRVIDRDVADVQVMPVTMVRVTGRLIISPEDRSLLAAPRFRVSVEAWSVDSDDNPGPQVPGTVGPDLTFQFFTWPGIGRVRVALWNAFLAPLVVTAVRLNGKDVMNTDITFVQDQHPSGLEVELKRR